MVVKSVAPSIEYYETLAKLLRGGVLLLLRITSTTSSTTTTTPQPLPSPTTSRAKATVSVSGWPTAVSVQDAYA